MKKFVIMLGMVLGIGVLLFLISATGQKQSRKPPQRLAKGVENAAELEKFFLALAAIKAGQRTEPVRIMHFGDSHIAADILTGEVRRRFQQDFGDGGAGYIVPRNPMSTRRRGVLTGATSGWIIEGIGNRIASDGIYGPAGISLSTHLPDERAWLQTAANHFEIYYVRQPGGGSIDVIVDGGGILDGPISLASRSPVLDYFSFDESTDENHRVEIRTLKPGRVRILGIVAEHIAPGVSYDALGINGARATRLLSWNATAFASALRERKPDLIIIAYGTNEVTDPDWTPGAYQRVLAGILRRLNSAAPQASILVYGPPDRADVPLAAQRMPAMIEAQRRAALEAGAAFWSSYDAMGGADSMNAWVAQGLGQGDHVHLTGAGYVRMGDLFYQEMARANGKASSNPSRPPGFARP